MPTPLTDLSFVTVWRKDYRC